MKRSTLAEAATGRVVKRKCAAGSDADHGDASVTHDVGAELQSEAPSERGTPTEEVSEYFDGEVKSEEAMRGKAASRDPQPSRTLTGASLLAAAGNEGGEEEEGEEEEEDPEAVAAAIAADAICRRTRTAAHVPFQEFLQAAAPLQAGGRRARVSSRARSMPSRQDALRSVCDN